MNLNRIDLFNIIQDTITGKDKRKRKTNHKLNDGYIGKYSS